MRSQWIILQFNKLINLIWQVVWSGLGGSRHSLQSHLRSVFYYHADKCLDRPTEGDHCFFDMAELLLQRSHAAQRGQSEPDDFIPQDGSLESYHWVCDIITTGGEKDHHVELKYLRPLIQAKVRCLACSEITLHCFKLSCNNCSYYSTSNHKCNI